MPTVALPLKVAATATAGATLTRGRHTPVNATSGSITMTLPTGSSEGVLISVEKTDSSANTVTVTGHMRGVAAQSVVLALQGETVRFAADSSGSWWPISGGSSATQRARANHTGTQLSTTISDFDEAARDAASAMITAGTNVTVVKNDAANTVTISSTGGSGTTAVGRTGRLTVASNLLPTDVKAQCDYVCTGVNDQTVINQALLRASRPADGFGGEGYIGVELVGPTFDVQTSSATPITMYPSTHLWGNGPGTLIRPPILSSGLGNDLGVIELINDHAHRVHVSDLTIGRHNSVPFNGTGIKFYMTGASGSQGGFYEIQSGADPFATVENVNIMYASRRGISYEGLNGGVRGGRIFGCLAWSCHMEGIAVDGASDCHIDQCTSTNGGDFPRFLIAGGNSKIANSKAYYSGLRTGASGGAAADGFLISSSRCEVADCSAQDNGRWGFRFTGVDALASGLVADSNQRGSGFTVGGGFEIANTGMYSGIHAYNRVQSPNTQDRAIVFTGSPQVYLSGRTGIDNTLGPSPVHVTGTPGTNSYVRLVRNGTTPYSVG